MQTAVENKGGRTGVVGALTVYTFPFPEATLSSLHFPQCEPIQVQRLLLIHLHVLRAPHRIKDSFVLIELRPVLFTEPRQQLLCASPFLYHLHCHSQKCWWGGGGREGYFSKNYMGIWSRACH